MHKKMSDRFLQPPEHPRRPEKTPPLGATDCHAHVFGPFERFPLRPDRHYTPAELTVERYLRMLDDIGFSRGVLVQGSAHGADNGALLHALSVAPERLRGVASITPKVEDRDLERMHDAGVRGARFIQIPGGSAKGAIGFEALKPLAPRLARLGWHAQLQAPVAELAALLPGLLGMGLTLVIDHLGLPVAGRGVNDPSFQQLLGWLRSGALWLKLTMYRSSDRYPDYSDMTPFLQACLEANPARLLWGSDWPHVQMTANLPDAGHLLDLFDQAATTDMRRQILVANPQALYQF